MTDALHPIDPVAQAKSPQGERPIGDYERAEAVEPKGSRSESPALFEPLVDPEAFLLAEHFLQDCKVATDWHRRSLSQAIQRAVESWFEDYEKEQAP